MVPAEDNRAPNEAYRNSPSERARAADLMRILPKGHTSVLDAGAREGYYSRLLAEHNDSVVALDLRKPEIVCPRVTCVEGDLTRLQFTDRSFDAVFCTEVLEHIPALEKACSEIMRVARHEIVIGVPFRQDTRIGRTTCNHCGAKNPPWGHLNRFDERKLRRLFYPFTAVHTSFVGSDRERTNAFAVWMMDLGGNPYGVYDQEEPCGHCGKRMSAPLQRSFMQRLCAAASLRITLLQTALHNPHGNWIHVVFRRSDK